MEGSFARLVRVVGVIAVLDKERYASVLVGPRAVQKKVTVKVFVREPKPMVAVEESFGHIKVSALNKSPENRFAYSVELSFFSFVMFDFILLHIASYYFNICYLSLQ
jgi:hypothetical protein